MKEMKTRNNVVRYMNKVNRNSIHVSKKDKEKSRKKIKKELKELEKDINT